MIDSTFVEAITALVPKPPVLVKHNGVEHVFKVTDGGLYEEVDYPKKAVGGQCLRVSTLDAVVDFLKHNRDKNDLSTLTVLVQAGTSVEVFGPADSNYGGRYSLLSAVPLLQQIEFGTYLDQEAFIIMLMTAFEPSDARDSLLSLIGSIKYESVRQVDDDGVTQTVTARSGAALATNVAVPKVLTLVPKRTFREISQPDSAFVVRLRSSREGELPQIALFETDDMGWRIVAGISIQAFLRRALAGIDVPVIR